MEFNTQKTFLVSSVTAYDMIGSSRLPSDTVRPAIPPETGDINNQIDFIRAWYRWPRGLLFYGPGIRSDDPRDKFEDNSVHIIGQHYFEKVKELHVKLVEFNANYEQQRATDQGKENMSLEAQKLYIRLGTIYKEYNNGEPIVVFPFNTRQWILHDGKWRINTDFPTTGIMYDVVSNEWREKAIAQSADFEANFDFVSTSLVVLGVLSTVQKYHYDHDELKRRKRHHDEPSVYVDELFETCANQRIAKIEIPKRDPCNYYFENGSPSIPSEARRRKAVLAVQRFASIPAWAWCKVFRNFKFRSDSAKIHDELRRRKRSFV
jgi:hypothetical protein